MGTGHETPGVVDIEDYLCDEERVATGHFRSRKSLYNWLLGSGKGVHTPPLVVRLSSSLAQTRRVLPLPFRPGLRAPDRTLDLLVSDGSTRQSGGVPLD